MALDQSALLALLADLKLTHVTDRIRLATETLYQELIDAEATAHIGADRFERNTDRTTQRNGTRSRLLSTTAGDLNLKIPKLRQGSFFPALLEQRRRVDQALFAVVMEAYLHGVSTRKIDDLVKALGADTGISKSEVSRICQDLDGEVAAFRDVIWVKPGTRMCSLTPRIARPGSTTASSLKPWWWPSALPRTGAARSSVSTSVTVRTRCSGPASCGRSGRAAWTG